MKLSGTMLRTRITSNMLLFSSSVACQKNPGIRDKGACEATENKEGAENETKQENVKKTFQFTFDQHIFIASKQSSKGKKCKINVR